MIVLLRNANFLAGKMVPAKLSLRALDSLYLSQQRDMNCTANTSRHTAGMQSPAHAYVVRTIPALLTDRCVATFPLLCLTRQASELHSTNAETLIILLSLKCNRGSAKAATCDNLWPLPVCSYPKHLHWPMPFSVASLSSACVFASLNLCVAEQQMPGPDLRLPRLFLHPRRRGF